MCLKTSLYLLHQTKRLVWVTLIKMENFNISESNFYREEFEKVGSTFVLKETEKCNKDAKFKSNFLDKKTLSFFRSLGGKEKVYQGRKFSLGCTISESISPDGQTKKLTYFFY